MGLSEETNVEGVYPIRQMCRTLPILSRSLVKSRVLPSNTIATKSLMVLLHSEAVSQFKKRLICTCHAGLDPASSRVTL
jgi:hypothetical protein